jgi:hypothetical protein
MAGPVFALPIFGTQECFVFRKAKNEPMISITFELDFEIFCKT